VTNLRETLVMECNELPALDEVGGGVERRVNRFLMMILKIIILC
jgi:hypothetical protein